MAEGLFRKQAVDYATRRVPGSVIFAAPPGFRLTAWLLLSIALSAVVIASVLDISRKETIRGTIVPKGGATRLVAPNGGRLAKVLVKEGELVPSGQRIVELVTSRALRDGDALEMTRASLADQRESAITSSNLKISKLTNDLKGLREQLTYIQVAIIEAEARVALAEEKVKLTKERLDRMETIVKEGFLSRSDYEAMRTASLDAIAERSNSRSAVLALRREHRSLLAQADGIPKEIEIERSERSRLLADLTLRNVDSESAQSYFATAPLDSIVATIAVRPGEYLKQGALIAILVPKDASFVAEFYVSPIVSARVEPGQKVRLVFDGLPAERYGYGSGTVRYVSAAAVSAADIESKVADANGKLYKVVVQIEKLAQLDSTDGIALRPGAAVSADIVIEQRSALMWLLDPIVSTVRRL